MGSRSLVKKGAIYLCDNKEIVWVGEDDYHGDFIDKHFTGQYYSTETWQLYSKREITLEEAVSKDLIKHRRFERMGSIDKADTVKTMLKVNGLLETLNFLAQTNLNLSKEELLASISCKE